MLLELWIGHRKHLNDPPKPVLASSQELSLARITSVSIFIAFQLARAGRYNRLLAVKTSGLLSIPRPHGVFGGAQLSQLRCNVAQRHSIGFEFPRWHLSDLVSLGTAKRELLINDLL